MNALIHREFRVESDLLVYARTCSAHARRQQLLSNLFNDATAQQIVTLCHTLAPPWICLLDHSWDAYHVMIQLIRERESEVVVIASDAIYC